MDVDTGVDDALALLYALSSPEVELVGCSAVAGNTTVEQATRNTLAVLEAAGRLDLPVAKGAARPMTRRLTTASFFHGPQGLAEVALPAPKAAPVNRPAPNFLLEMADRFPNELTVIATGPLTNLALTLLLDPNWGRKLKRLVIMGGAVKCPGNITPVAEANFYNDPEAAQLVLHCGANITLVGLDVTSVTKVSWAELAPFDEADRRATLLPTASLSLELLRFYIRSYGETNGAQLHDPLAVGVVTHPGLVKTERMQIEIETQGELTRGQSVGYARRAIDALEDKGDYDDVVGVRYNHPSNAAVCTEVRSADFVTLFRRRLGLL